MIEIEKGIPLPVGRHKYPFLDMEIGDSFFVGNRTTGEMSYHIAYFRKKHPLRKFTCRTVDGGVRCWRIE
jgi:hypothetical protein